MNTSGIVNPDAESHSHLLRSRALQHLADLRPGPRSIFRIGIDPGEELANRLVTDYSAVVCLTEPLYFRHPIQQRRQVHYAICVSPWKALDSIQ